GAIFPTTPDPLATLTTLEAALGHRPKSDDVAAALASAFESEHGLDLRPEGLTASETAAVERLVRETYPTDVWLARHASAANTQSTRASAAAGLPSTRPASCS